MAKRVKFPLKMKNDVLVRDIEELRENFDVESLIEHFESGRLQMWLEDRYYDEEASKVANLDHDQADFASQLCEILGVQIQEEEIPEFDTEFVKRRIEKLEYLKSLTEDEEIWAKVDDIAVDQEDLVDLIDLGRKTIYLCNGIFVVPLSVPNMTYIGLLEPCAIIRATDNVNFKERNITFQNMPFFWNVSGLTTNDRSFQAEWLFMEGRYQESADMCRELVKGNNPRAIMLLSRILSNYLVDNLEAKKYKDMGAKLNFAYSLLDKNEWKFANKAKGILKRIAQQGTSFDKYYYGFALYKQGANGNDEFDDDMLVAYFTASKQGNPDAYNALGSRYQSGEGVSKSYHKAMEWYQRAAEKKHASAQNSIGVLYDNGYGVEKDSIKAMGWFQKSANQNNMDAQRNMGILYQYGRVGVEVDYRKAAEWYQKAADNGNLTAMEDLAQCYDSGKGVSQDYGKALELRKKAAKQDYLTSISNIGWHYRWGKGVTPDYQEAMKWFLRAAERKCGYSQRNIGDLYYNGYGVKQDIQEAKKWYQQAADNGDSDAQEMLKKL